MDAYAYGKAVRRLVFKMQHHTIVYQRRSTQVSGIGVYYPNYIDDDAKKLLHCSLKRIVALCILIGDLQSIRDVTKLLFNHLLSSI